MLQDRQGCLICVDPGSIMPPKEVIVLERTYCVYKHTNRANGKVYIGVTYDINRRWRGSGCAYKSNPHFWQAIQKYGWDGFKHEVLADGLQDYVAFEMERRLIAEHRSTERECGYNHSSGGEIPLVWQRGEAHPMYGKHHSPESRAKMSASHTGGKHRCWGTHLPEITRKRIGDANRGRAMSEEQKQLLAKIGTGRKASDETRAKMSRTHMGHPVSEETRQKIREAKESKPIVQLTKEGEVLHVWPSITSASQGSGLDRSQIRKACNGVLKTSGGFVWQYK